jgi:hypothetical protein
MFDHKWSPRRVDSNVTNPERLLFLGNSTGWVIMGVVELLCLCVLIGFWNPERFWLCWRAVGAIVFGGYLAYLVSTLLSGQWFGDGRRSSATAFNALMGLIVFGYPGFMYAVFGRFTWRPETELDDYTDEWPDIDEVDAEAGG